MEFRSSFSQVLNAAASERGKDDRELLESCLAGDERAWSALVAKYKRLIYSIPIKNGFQPADAADVFQSVWVDLLESLGRIRDGEKLKAWLITVTVRKCSRLRAKMRRAAEIVPAEEESQLAGQECDLSRLSAEMEAEQAVREALEKLSPRCVTLIRHLFFDEPRLSYSRIAEKIGVSSNTIGSMRERCLEKLRQVLEASGAGLR